MISAGQSIPAVTSCTQWLPCTLAPHAWEGTDTGHCSDSHQYPLGSLGGMQASWLQGMPSQVHDRSSHHNTSHTSQHHYHHLRACSSTSTACTANSATVYPRCVRACILAGHPPSVVLGVRNVKDPTELATLRLLLRLRQIQPRKVELHLLSLL